MSSTRSSRFLSLLRKVGLSDLNPGRSNLKPERSNLKSELSNLNFPLSIFHFPLPSAARARAGSALVIVLGMLSVLLLMGVAFSVTMRTERAGAANMRHAAIARHILDSALARTMSDLDKALEKQGDLPVPPDGVIVAVSSQTGGEASISPLSPEAALHIPADQLVAAVFTNAQWLPIYGDVRINGTSANDPARDDSPVGRYAFVVLNGCGYLDPNVVGVSNRLFGLSPCEIDIAGDGDRVLGMPGAKKADTFLDKRDNEWGHFVTMRDFLRPSVTNILGYRPMDISGANKKFPTNSFFIGSLALDDFAPPSGKDSNGYPIRKPKFSLRDDNGDVIDPKDLLADSDWCDEFKEAMQNSFAATRKGWKANQSGYMPKSFNDPFSNKKFDYPLLAARNFLEMLDDDGCPGGSKTRTFSNIGNAGSENEDEYIKALSGLSWNWDRLPFVEPVPLLDNLVIVGGDPDSGPFFPLTYEANREEIANPEGGPPQLGNVTNIEFTITLSALTAPIYPGWNVPDGAEGTYSSNWRIFFPNPDDPDDIHNFDTENAGIDGKYKKFLDALKAALTPSYEDVVFEFSLERDGKGYPSPSWRMTGDSKKLSKDIKFSIKPDDVVANVDDNNIGDYVPEEFGFVLHAVGIMGRGGKNDFKEDIVQVVPCQQKPLGTSYSSATMESFLDIPLVIKRANAVRKGKEDDGDGDDIPVLGAVYAVDPRFSFKWGSWLWIPGRSDNGAGPHMALAESLREEKLGSPLTILDAELNPLAMKYLHDPYKKYDGEAVFYIMTDMMEGTFGGVSDEMRCFSNDNDYSLTGNAAEMSARTVFFDLSAKNDSPWAFTRVGQLGCVPIGTYRTIALMDGFDNASDAPHVEARQRVLDYFTMNPPRDAGSSGSNGNPGDPVRTERFTSRVGINPPRFPKLNSKNEVVPGDPNLLPLTAALNNCLLREWDSSSETVDWDTAAEIAEVFGDSLDRDDEGVQNVDGVGSWDDDWDDADGVTRSLSVLGRADSSDAGSCKTIDTVLREKFNWATSIDREGVIRNTAEMLTTRQQLFTILLKADSFTPMSGFSDADHGMSLASVQAIAHIWRDPEPLRDADGTVILDAKDNPIHAWVLLDLYQF